jgi:tetratricopeptide (TPR) repeat protein
MNGTNVATEDQKVTFGQEPVAGGEAAALALRERALIARRAALMATCEAAFLRLQGATQPEADAWRADLARLHRDLGETVRRLSDVPWDADGPTALYADLATILADAAGSGGVVGLAQLTGAQLALSAGDLGPADKIFAELAALNTGTADQAARLAFAQGLIAEETLRWTDAARHYAMAARLDPNLRSLQKARALACQTGDLTAAFRLGQGLMVLAETSGAPEDRAMAMAEHALTLEAQDRFAEAEGFLRKAAQTARGGAGQPGAEPARYLAQLARALEAQDRFTDAEGAVRKALELTRTTLGEGHPDFASRLNALAGILAAQDRDTEAEQLHQKALDLSRRLGQGAHPVTIDCLTGLAQLSEKRGRFAVAEELYRQALKLDQDLMGRTHPDHAGRLCALAEVVRAQRRLPEAEALFRQALEIDLATIGNAHRDYGVALNNLAGVVEAQGRAAEAEGLYAAALAIFRATLGDLHPATMKVTKNFRALIAAHLPESVHRPGVDALWDLGQQGLPDLSGR